VGDDERGVHTPWHHQAISVNHTSGAHPHPQELPGFDLWYFTGDASRMCWGAHDVHHFDIIGLLSARHMQGRGQRPWASGRSTCPS
jgi:hypothetical protein